MYVNEELLKDRKDYRSALIWRRNGSKSPSRQIKLDIQIKQIESDINLIQRGVVVK